MKKMYFLILSLALLSCSDDDDNCYYYETRDEAYGILANVSPNSGDLYFHADENQINSNPVNYGNTFGFYNFYTGSRLFSLLNNVGDILATQEVLLEDNQIFGAFAVNTFDQIELFVNIEANVNPNSSHAVVRFINLSPDSSPITISSGTSIVAENLAFKEVSDFVEFNDGNFDFTFSDASTGQVLFIDTDVDLYPNRIYTIYTKGFVMPPSGSNDTFSTEHYWHY